MSKILNHYEQKRLKKIAQLCKGKTVLDIGFAHMPNPYFKNIYTVGVDLIEPRKPSGYDEEEIGNAYDLKSIFGKRKFDTIVLGELIEHIENPYQLLKSIKQSISLNGHLILSTPNPISFPVIFMEIARNRKYFYSNNHLYYFAPRWMEKIIEICGFTVIKTIPVGLWFPRITPPCPVWMSYQNIYLSSAKEI